MTILVNNHAVERFNFSGGECHVKLASFDIGDKTEILANLNSSDEIMSLLLTVDAIRRINSKTAINLSIPYFPYARQDRVCNEGEALSVAVMANLINSLHCETVTIHDPHSDVTPALLNNCKILSLADIIAKSSLLNVIYEKSLSLLSPDAGAEKKVRAVAKKISLPNKSLDVLCASKTRDTRTGDITSTEIHGDVMGKNIIILDDICDGGRTFIELSKVLKSMNSGDIYLYVTHGIFSKGLGVLEDNFEHIYCYHTLLQPNQINSSFLTILNNTGE